MDQSQHEITNTICDLLLTVPVQWCQIKMQLSKLDQINRLHWGPIDPKSTLSKVDRNPLQVAVLEIQSPKALKFLVDHGFHVDSLWQGVCHAFGGQRVEIRGLSCLTCAIARNDMAMIEMLIQLGANVNMEVPCYSYFNANWHPYFMTPLITAVEMACKAETVEMLMKYGADTSYIDSSKIETRLLPRTLKEWCRFAIRHQLIVVSKQYKHLQDLKLPKPMINYLKFRPSNM